jgi:hypothetical protein
MLAGWKVVGIGVGDPRNFSELCPSMTMRGQERNAGG